MARLKRALKFVGDNASTIIALSSFLIALTSLVFSIVAQHNDLVYRELAIRPYVSVGADASNFAVEYKNFGYGHALIDRVSFGLDGKCFSSDKTPAGDFDASMVKFFDKVTDDIYNNALPTMAERKVKKKFNVTYHAVSAGGVIRAGEAFQILKLESDSLRDLLQTDGGTLQAYRNAFSKAVSMMPLRIRYCSATGLYCDDLPTENETCP